MLSSLSVRIVTLLAITGLGSAVHAQRVAVPLCMNKSASVLTPSKTTSTPPTTDCDNDRINECGYQATYTPPATSCDQSTPGFCCVLSQDSPTVVSYQCSGNTCKATTQSTGTPVDVWSSQACGAANQNAGCGGAKAQ